MRARHMPPPYYANLTDALILQLQGLLDLELVGEQCLTLAARACANPLARAALDEHRELVGEQVARLRQSLESLGAIPERRPSAVTAALARDLDEVIGADGEPEARDAVLIASIQALEHLEIAAYGTARAWAERLERRDLATMLARSLEEESVCDERLSAIAEHLVNLDASP
jgi:ferritin-like metal-binding protein YciE